MNFRFFATCLLISPRRFFLTEIYTELLWMQKNSEVPKVSIVSNYFEETIRNFGDFGRQYFDNYERKASSPNDQRVGLIDHRGPRFPPRVGRIRTKACDGCARLGTSRAFAHTARVTSTFPLELMSSRFRGTTQRYILNQDPASKN